MDASELALAMLEYERIRKDLDALEEKIKDAVLRLESTQTVGNVRATFSAGRKSYDYEGAVSSLDLEDGVLDQFLKTSVDYRAACKGLGVEDVPFTQGEPSVSVKLLS